MSFDDAINGFCQQLQTMTNEEMDAARDLAFKEANVKAVLVLLEQQKRRGEIESWQYGHADGDQIVCTVGKKMAVPHHFIEVKALEDR